MFPGEFSDDVLRGKAFRRHQIQRAIQMEIAANSRVRVDGERLYPFRMPVIAPRESVVHSLLHDRPGAAQCKLPNYLNGPGDVGNRRGLAGNVTDLEDQTVIVYRRRGSLYSNS